MMSETATMSSGRDLAWKLAAVACVIAFLAIVASGYGVRTRLHKTTEAGWPPRLNEPYPELNLIDSSGQAFSIRSLRGRPVLVELVGTSSASSQAFAGGHQRGGLAGVTPQAGIESLGGYMEKLAGGLKLEDERVTHLKILLFDAALEAPRPALIDEWSSHFGLRGRANVHVTAGREGLVGRASYDRVPGFHLLDKDLVLRYDAAGYKPPHSLFKQLLPALPKFVE